MARYWLKIADFNLFHLYLAPPLGVIPLEFRRDFWYQKTRDLGLLHGLVCVILGLTIFLELRFVTDRQTNRRTEGHDDSTYGASIVSRGNLQMAKRNIKNVNISSVTDKGAEGYNGISKPIKFSFQF